MLQVLKQCQKELSEWDEQLRGQLADAVARLERGQSLCMPLSRPMPSIGKGVHELRFRDRAGIYRVIYFFEGSGSIWLLHAFKKKTHATPKQNLELAQQRLRSVLK